MQGKTTDQLRGSWHNFSKYRPLIRCPPCRARGNRQRGAGAECR